jgi:replication factor C subunit 1
MSGLWTDKYAPRSVRDLVGNQGRIQTLAAWLNGWYDQFGPGSSTTTTTKGKKSKAKRAALLAGAPGLGKTSAATLVIKAAGFNPIEFNASDVRSQKAIKQRVARLTEYKTMHSFFGAAAVCTGNKAPKPKRHVIIMDEVDGMSTGDRGGLAELNKLIKTSEVPIVCICNDAGSPKMRTLKGNCLYLLFEPLTPNQVRPRLFAIAKAEGMSMDYQTADALCAQAGGDMRQILNLMQMWSNGTATDRITGSGTKNEQRSPFDLMGDFLDAQAFRKTPLMDKMESYFGDASLVPLLVQENYLSTQPAVRNHRDPLDMCRKLKATADSIAAADVLETKSRIQGSFGFMPYHAVMSCMIPALHMHGQLPKFPGFPKILSTYSTGKKMKRLNRQVSAHVWPRVSATPSSMVTDYLPVLMRMLTDPLQDPAGIDAVVDRMMYYGLTRQDWADLIDLVLTRGTPPKIATKIKSAFTRAYNKRAKTVRAIDAIPAVKAKPKKRPRAKSKDPNKRPKKKR